MTDFIWYSVVILLAVGGISAVWCVAAVRRSELRRCDHDWRVVLGDTRNVIFRTKLCAKCGKEEEL